MTEIAVRILELEARINRALKADDLPYSPVEVMSALVDAMIRVAYQADMSEAMFRDFMVHGAEVYKEALPELTNPWRVNDDDE